MFTHILKFFIIKQEYPEGRSHSDIEKIIDKPCKVTCKIFETYSEKDKTIIFADSAVSIL